MSYKYNHSIQFDLDHLSQYEDVVGLEEKKRELDHVYEQAAKADEYEAKAKAWDLLKLKLEGKNKSILSNPKASDEDLDFAGNNTAVLWEMSDLEMKFRKEQESGEPNA